MRISSLGNIVLWMYQNAHKVNVPLDTNEQITQLIAALQGQTDVLLSTEARRAGYELRKGRPRCALAKKVYKIVIRSLGSLPFILYAIDSLGYNPLLVRALLQRHFWRIKASPLGSEQHIVYIDLISAIERASLMSRKVLFLLVAGFSPQEIGGILKTNGSRAVSRAVNEVSELLSGAHTRDYSKS